MNNGLQPVLIAMACSIGTYWLQRGIGKAIQLPKEIEDPLTNRTEAKALAILQNQIQTPSAPGQVGLVLQANEYNNLIWSNLWFCAGLFSYMAISGSQPVHVRASVASLSVLGKIFVVLAKMKQRKLLSIRQASTQIPERWADDLILKKFTCAINLAPTQKPLKDSLATGVMYDRNTMGEWMGGSHFTSPLTRASLNPATLIVDQLRTASSLIDYRLAQLKALEEVAKRELSCTDKEVLESAKVLDQEVRDFLKTKPEEILTIPLFLRSSPGIHCCPITNKPIQERMILKYLEGSNPSIAMKVLSYEKEAIERHVREKPNDLPLQWPVEALPFPLKKEYLEEVVTHKGDTEKVLQSAQQELIKYYL